MHMRSYVRVSVLSLFATGVVVYFVVAVVVLYTRIFCKMRMYMDVHRTLTMSGNAVQICLPHFGFSTRRELLCVCASMGKPKNTNPSLVLLCDARCASYQIFPPVERKCSACHHNEYCHFRFAHNRGRHAHN